MQMFQGHIEVSNYPMITRNKIQLDELKRVSYLSGIDSVERKVIKGFNIIRSLLFFYCFYNIKLCNSLVTQGSGTGVKADSPTIPI